MKKFDGNGWVDENNLPFDPAQDPNWKFDGSQWRMKTKDELTEDKPAAKKAVRKSVKKGK